LNVNIVGPTKKYSLLPAGKGRCARQEAGWICPCVPPQTDRLLDRVEGRRAAPADSAACERSAPTDGAGPAEPVTGAEQGRGAACDACCVHAFSMRSLAGVVAAHAATCPAAAATRSLTRADAQLQPRAERDGATQALQAWVHRVQHLSGVQQRRLMRPDEWHSPARKVLLGPVHFGSGSTLSQ
jgi:hypothetical protein